MTLFQHYEGVIEPPLSRGEVVATVLMVLAAVCFAACFLMAICELVRFLRQCASKR